MQQIIRAVKRTIKLMSRPQIILCGLVLVIALLGSLFELMGVSIVVPFVYAIQSPETIINNPWFSKLGLDRIIAPNQVIYWLGFGVVLLYIFKNAFAVFNTWIQIKFSCKIQREISVSALASYLSRGYSFFLNINYGKYVRGVLSDPAAIYSVIYSVFSLLSAGLTIVLICAFMLYTDWMLSIGIMILAAICVLLIYFVFRKQMYALGLESRHYSMKADQAVAQSFFGIKDVLLLRKQNHFLYEYEINKIKLQDLQCRITVGNSCPNNVIEAICVTGLMGTVLLRYGIGGVDANFIPVLAAFAIGAFRILPSLGRISSALNTITSSLPSIDSLYEEMQEAEAYRREHPEVSFGIDEKSAEKKLISKGKVHNIKKAVKSNNADGDEFKDCLEIKNITFQYLPELGNVLEDVNIEIKKGEAIAFIGESGAGKSTMADIVLGLLLPQTGAVYMDGKDITDIPAVWANTIGYVPQAVFLCDDTIRKNIAFGISEEEIDDNRVAEAIKRAELETFINTLPEGVETEVGDHGVRLSGGQRQRIAIARALYTRPEILVLDEATSALDNDTESAIMEAIESLYGQVTLIIIAHRLSTIRKCDMIYEVKNKKVIVRDKAEIFADNPV